MSIIDSIRTLFFVCLLLVLISPIAGTDELGHTEVSVNYSSLVFDTDFLVSYIGYTVNNEQNNPERIFVLPRDTVLIQINSLPPGLVFKAVVELEDRTDVLIGNPITISDFPRDKGVNIPVHLSLTLPPSSSDNEPEKPEIPDIPLDPEQPVDPDTPGSDEPYLPILPPAGSVYNLAGFIPLGAGALLLFLVFFWRRKVYRILKSHAKKHGEKPEKEHLKEIADAIIKLVRDEGRYPEWKKNSDVAKCLSSDIVSVLDEMNYARAVPRGALVAEIIKAARGRINRHRL
jgi:hypothetical protein